ncbi:hypothetical protein HKD37_01G002632 [Glycine soja]
MGVLELIYVYHVSDDTLSVQGIRFFILVHADRMTRLKNLALLLVYITNLGFGLAHNEAYA